MKELQKEYRFSDYQSDYFSNKSQKGNLNPQKEIDDLKKQLEKNLLFKNIIIENIKALGRKIALKYEKNIILLSNLKNVFPETLNKIPIITFLQAFMIKEIGAGYGFDFDTVNYCFKKFDRDIQNLKMEKQIPKKKKEEIKIYKQEYIEKQKRSNK